MCGGGGGGGGLDGLNPPLSKDFISQGPLINAAAVAKVAAHVADALAKGAIAKTGGKQHALGACLLCV